MSSNPRAVRRRVGRPTRTSATSRTSARATPRGKSPHALPSKARILEVAATLFGERGFAAISVRDIARECNVNIPTIYHFYGDKQSLYDACYKATFEAAAQTLHDAATQPGTASERIRRFTVELCRILMENHNFRRLLQREFLREERRRITTLTTHHFQDEFRLMTAAIAELHGEAQAMERCFSIYGLALGLLQMRRIGELAGMDKGLAATPENLADHVLQIVLPG